MFGIKEFKRSFFDWQKIQKDASRKTERVLSRFGAFVRRTAKSLLRRKKGTSTAGEPPRSKKGFLHKFLYFAYDRPNQNVVIGPAKLEGMPTAADGTPVPGLLEHGGDAIAVKTNKRGHRYERPYKMEPRPFIGPAAAKELPNLPGWWKAV